MYRDRSFLFHSEFLTFSIEIEKVALDFKKSSSPCIAAVAVSVVK